MAEDTQVVLSRLDLAPNQLAVAVEYALNGGNLSGASVALGHHEDYAERLKRENASFRQALTLIDERRSSTALEPLRTWAELQDKARRKIEELMDAQKAVVTRLGIEYTDDNQTQLAAAKTIIEQHEGKPRQKVEAVVETRTQGLISDADLHMALALVAHNGLPLRAALEYVKSNRETVKGWIAGPPGLTDLEGPTLEAEIEEEPDARSE